MTLARAAVLAAMATAAALLMAAPAIGWIPRAALAVPIGLLGWLCLALAGQAKREARTSAALEQRLAEHGARLDAAAADLRDAEARLRSIVDSAVDGMVATDERGTIATVNPAALRLFGYPAVQVVGRPLGMLVRLPDHEEDEEYIQRHFLDWEPASSREASGRRQDGSLFPLRVSVGGLVLGGQLQRTVTLHDLSESLGLAQRLRASEARWRSIIQSAVDGIVVIDAQGRIEAFNRGSRAAVRLRRKRAARRQRQHADAVAVPRGARRLPLALSRHGQANIIGIGREVTGRRADGSTFPLHLSVGEVTVEGERRFTGILHDLSARVRIEEQLRERAALARLGEMAAVIAHEVKNPLAGVRGAIQVFRNRLATGGSDVAILDDVVGRIDALDSLMKDLLLFARPPQPRLTPLDIGQLVSMTAALVRHDPGARDVQIDVTGSAPAIAVDAELLKIVFQNLLVNGAQALQGRGRIGVAIGAADGTCSIAFTDDGPGIPSELRDRVFAPFFTTKARGSGLGLATAKRLVEAHHGQIEVRFPPAGGSTFTVRLPLADGLERAIESAPPPANADS